MNRNLGSQFHPHVRDYPAERAGGVEGSVVGMVPTHVLDRYKEWDRTDEANHPGSAEKIAALREDLRSGTGIREPLDLHYNPRERWAVLGEGNHRLAAAKAEGVPEVPVRVTRHMGVSPDSVRDTYWEKRGRQAGAPATHKPEAEYSPGYLSSSLHPSMLEFGEKPKSDVDHIQDLLRPSWQQ